MFVVRRSRFVVRRSSCRAPNGEPRSNDAPRTTNRKPERSTSNVER